jgi:hypothetical protein
MNSFIEMMMTGSIFGPCDKAFAVPSNKLLQNQWLEAA